MVLVLIVVIVALICLDDKPKLKRIDKKIELDAYKYARENGKL